MKSSNRIIASPFLTKGRIKGYFFFLVAVFFAGDFFFAVVFFAVVFFFAVAMASSPNRSILGKHKPCPLATKMAFSTNQRAHIVLRFIMSSFFRPFVAAWFFRVYQKIGAGSHQEAWASKANSIVSTRCPPVSASSSKICCLR